MAPNNTFTHCRCPHCQASLHEIPPTPPACPLCHHPLDPHDVWLTRRYPGEINLPGWLHAFGWPFLLMLGGFALAVLKALTHWPIPFKLPALMIATGMIFFLLKLATNGEE